MGTRKRKSRDQEETIEEDDCFQMQYKIVNMLREKVCRLEEELNYLRSHRSLLYRAWSTPIYPPEYIPGSWTPPKAGSEQNGPQDQAAGVREKAGKAKRRKIVKKKRATPISSPEREPVPVQETEDDDSDESSSSQKSSSESGDEPVSPIVETVTTETGAMSEPSSSEESASDEEGEKIKSAESASEDESSSDSDDDKKPVTPAIGETKTQPIFPRVNWANEPRKRTASRASSSSGSDSNDSDKSVSAVEVADEEVISQTKAYKAELRTDAVKDCGNENSVATKKKNEKKRVPKMTLGTADEQADVKFKKKGKASVPSAEPPDTANPSTPTVDKISSDASPEDIFDWNVLGTPGPWTQPESLSFTHWHGSSEDSGQWMKQFTSLPCRFSSCNEYISRNQWLVFEECKAMLESSWEIMQKSNGSVKDSRVGVDGTEDNLESRIFLLRPMHRCADDSFSFVEVDTVDRRRVQLDTSEVVLVSFPKFPDMRVLASVSSRRDKSILLKTRVDLQSYGGQCKLAEMCNMVTLKRQFIALVNVAKIWHSLRQPLLDPLLNSGCTMSPPSDDCLDEHVQLPADVNNTLLTWKQHGIFNNRQLLTMAALSQTKQGVLLVQGPPGTGKTSTIVGMISALCIEEPGVKILVCAASNAAVDEIVSRLMHGMLDSNGKLYAPKLGTLVRVGVQSSTQVACHPVTMDTLLAKFSSGSLADVKREILSGATIVCSTLSGSGSPIFDESDQKFDVLIIDEAAQALECEALIALRRVKGRCVIVGDPRQLSATVIQRPGTAYGRSLFERMQQGGMKTFLMTTQYRMHPQISKYPSARFYRGCLRDSKSTQCMSSIFRQDACDEGISCDGYRFRLGPYSFLDVSWGAEEIEATGHSLSNVEEAAVVATVVSGVVKSLRNGRKADIGVITPYLAQRSTILTSLLKYKIDESVCEVNTVDGFQGREKDVIILSCVRAVTEKGLGFVSDERRMNVALTRAKHALIIVGHGKTLKSQSASWNALLEDAASRGCYQVLRDAGLTKGSGKSSPLEETGPAASEVAAKFHSAQTSPVKKMRTRPSRSNDLPTSVKMEPATCDFAHHNSGCGHNQSADGRHPNPMDTVKRMRGAVRMNGPSQNRGGGKSRRASSNPINGGFADPVVGVAPPNQHIYFGPPPDEHQQMFRSPNPSYDGRHFLEAHEHIASFAGGGQGVNRGGHWHKPPGIVNQVPPFINRANRGRR